MGHKPTAGGRRRRSSHDAREAILDAAEALLASEGVERVALKPVASAAGITHSGVLHHFGNREGLIEALFHRASRRLRQAIFDVLSNSSPAAGTDQVLDLFVQIYDITADPARAPILAWLIASGRDPLPADEELGLAELVDHLHALRVARDPTTADQLDDTRFAVELAVLIMFGDLMVGASTRRRLGEADTAAKRARFRRRVGQLLLSASA